MITPLFQVTQDDSYVILVIRVPYIKASALDYTIIGSEFKLYVKPYYLRLTLPQAFAEDGTEKASYDIDKGELTIALRKLVTGNDTVESLPTKTKSGL